MCGKIDYLTHYKGWHFILKNVKYTFFLKRFFEIKTDKDMENVKAIDSIGIEFGIGTAVAVLTAGNFIYGHVTAINEDKIDVIPDIGYRTSKPNFRLKKIYKTTSNHIAVLKDQEKFVKKDD